MSAKVTALVKIQLHSVINDEDSLKVKFETQNNYFIYKESEDTDNFAIYLTNEKKNESVNHTATVTTKGYHSANFLREFNTTEEYIGVTVFHDEKGSIKTVHKLKDPRYFKSSIAENKENRSEKHHGNDEAIFKLSAVEKHDDPLKVYINIDLIYGFYLKSIHDSESEDVEIIISKSADYQSRYFPPTGNGDENYKNYVFAIHVKQDTHIPCKVFHDYDHGDDLKGNSSDQQGNINIVNHTTYHKIIDPRSR